MSDPNGRLRATITGVVQGIGFRYFVGGNARPLGLTGWARNRPDGFVEDLADGSRASLGRLATLLRRGPQRAMIGSFGLDRVEPTGEHRGFSIRRF